MDRKSYLGIAVPIVSLLFIFNILYLKNAQAEPGCSDSDYEIWSSYTEEVMNAIMTGDMDTFNNLASSLQKKLSRSCNKLLSQHKKEFGSCTAKEEQILASYGPQLLEATLAFDLNKLAVLSKEQQRKVSPSCIKFIKNIQEQQLRLKYPPRTVDGSRGGPTIVTDHGGGAMSTSDVHCGSGGCIPLN